MNFGAAAANPARTTGSHSYTYRTSFVSCMCVCVSMYVSVPAAHALPRVAGLRCSMRCHKTMAGHQFAWHLCWWRCVVERCVRTCCTAMFAAFTIVCGMPVRRVCMCFCVYSMYIQNATRPSVFIILPSLCVWVFDFVVIFATVVISIVNFAFRSAVNCLPLVRFKR